MTPLQMDLSLNQMHKVLEALDDGSLRVNQVRHKNGNPHFYIWSRKGEEIARILCLEDPQFTLDRATRLWKHPGGYRLRCGEPPSKI